MCGLLVWAPETLYSAGLRGGDEPKPPPAFFRRLSMRDGLSNPTVYAISQDTFDFMWFGTAEGIDRYDGYSIRSFRIASASSASASSASASSASASSASASSASASSASASSASASSASASSASASSASASSASASPAVACSHWVRSLYIDKRNRVWYGSNTRGACRYDTLTNRWQSFLYDNAPTQQPIAVRAIVGDEDGAIWMATSAGLAYFAADSDSPQFFRHDPDNPNSLSHDDLFGLTIDADGVLWIASYGGGVNRFDPKTGQFTHFRHDDASPATLSSDLALDVVLDRSGDVWVGTWGGGLNRLDPRQGDVQRFRHNDGDPTSLSSDLIMKVLEDSNGRIWVGSFGGGLNLLERSSGRFTHYRHDPADLSSIGSDSVMALYEDRNGLLWVGAEGGGVSILNLNAQPFSTYRRKANDPNSLSPGLVTAFTVDADGVLWVGTNNSGLNRLDRVSGDYTHVRANPGVPGSLASDQVGALLTSRDGVLWVGTAKGLDRYDPQHNRFVNYRHDPDNPNSLVENTIYKIVEDEDGILWIGAYGGLSRFDPVSETFTNYVHDADDPNSLSVNTVRALLPADGDVLWIGTQGGGLNRLDRRTGQITRYHSALTDSPALGGAITALALDSRARLWLGTDGDGLNMLDPTTGAVEHLGTEDGLPATRILAIAYASDTHGGDGEIWFSTGRGLSRLDLNDRSIFNYDASDGLLESGFATYSAYQSEQGELFFGGGDGFIAFAPAEIEKTVATPAVELIDLLIDNKPVDVGDGSILAAPIYAVERVTLPDDVRSFAVIFAAPDQWEPANVRYRYRLDGHDSHWIEALPTQRMASYTNLAPGEYRLEIQSADIDGAWNEPGRALVVQIQPAWWEVWWVRMLTGGAMLAGGVFAVAGAIQWRLRRSRWRNRQLEEQVAERTAELSALLAVLQSITSALDLAPLLTNILDDIQGTIPHDASLILVHDVEEARVRVYQFRPMHEKLIEYYLSESALAPFIERVGEDISAHVQASKLADICPMELLAMLPEDLCERSCLMAPLAARSQRIGVLLLLDNRSTPFNAVDVESLQGFANQIAIAVEQARLYAQSQQLAASVERNRLAQELHDSVSQYLHAIGLYVDAAERALAAGRPEASSDNIRHAQQLAREALDALRVLIVDLRLTALQEKGLVATLRAYLDKMTPRSGLTVNLNINYPIHLPPEVEFELYRIAQEAIANVLKHANAAQLTVKLVALDADAGGGVVLEISDDGIGFDPTASRSISSFGLDSIAKRAEKLNAVLTIASAPGEGATVRVEIQ